jgi:hypothetical protein
VLKGRVFVDAITFNPSAARLTAEMFGREAMVLGSDYPFDMGDPDPVGSARTADLDLDELTANALRWLGETGSAVPDRVQRARAAAAAQTADKGSE